MDRRWLPARHWVNPHRLPAGFLLWYFLSCATRLREPDRDRLLATRDLLSGTAAFQRAPLALLHRLLDLGAGGFTVFPCHQILLDRDASAHALPHADEAGSAQVLRLRDARRATDRRGQPTSWR